MAWLRLTARGTAGHGSMLQPDNAVTELAEAVARIGRHEWPVRLTPAVAGVPRGSRRGARHRIAPNDPPAAARQGRPDLTHGRRDAHQHRQSHHAGRGIQGERRSRRWPRPQWTAGSCPGYEEEFFAEIDGLLGPGVRREFVHHDIAVETTLDGDLATAMTAALVDQDPDAQVVPYCLSGGTDAKSFSRLGMRCFGFTPLRLPPDLDFSGMFHGVDERVPVDALQFGVRVLDKFLDLC